LPDEGFPGYIKPGKPWQNGYVESFNDKLRDELLNLKLSPAEPNFNKPMIVIETSPTPNDPTSPS
jgi:transposase InsO family protein